MKIDVAEFRLAEGDEVDLGLWATNVKPMCKSKKAYRQVLQDQVERLSDQQRLLYASNRHALLLVFQAMDTAGKDGAIGHVMSGVKPWARMPHSRKASNSSLTNCGRPTPAADSVCSRKVAAC